MMQVYIGSGHIIWLTRREHRWKGQADYFHFNHQSPQRSERGVRCRSGRLETVASSGESSSGFGWPSARSRVVLGELVVEYYENKTKGGEGNEAPDVP